VTTNTGGVARVIGDVGKFSYLFPVVGGDFVAGIAGALMLFGGVRKL
jgi:hypothetical protein